MTPLEFFNFSLWTVLIEFVGTLLILGYLLVALFTLVRSRNIEQARYLVTAGILNGLGFKLAGTLLRTLQLHTWQQILMFAAIFALRTVLKRFFTWEQQRIRQDQGLAGD